MDENAKKHFTEEELKMLEEMDDNWDGAITVDLLEEMLADWKTPKEMKSKYITAKPRCESIETQTDESALENMERVPWKTETKSIYVPCPIPFPVYIPVPVYLMETPVPFPFPVPIPFPIPIPLVLDNNKSSETSSNNQNETLAEKLTIPVPVENIEESEDFEMIDLDDNNKEKNSNVDPQQQLQSGTSIDSSSDRDESLSAVCNENTDSAMSSTSVASISPMIQEQGSSSVIKKVVKLSRVRNSI